MGQKGVDELNKPVTKSHIKFRNNADKKIKSKQLDTFFDSVDPAPFQSIFKSRYEMIRCRGCNMFFKNKTRLWRHLDCYPTNIKSHKCRYCNEKFYTCLDKTAHEQKSHKKKPTFDFRYTVSILNDRSF